MSEFIGRTGSQRVYSYPERRGGDPALLFARNSAHGPTASEAISDAVWTPVPWSFIDSDGSAGVDVPITPRSTGILLISGVITVKNSTAGEVLANLRIEINGTPLTVPFALGNTINVDGAEAGAFEAIPFAISTPAYPVGVVADIQIQLISSVADALSIMLDSSTIEVREVPAATG